MVLSLEPPTVPGWDGEGHAAAMAREYGMPAVVRIRDGTQCIPDGAWASVDGTLGTAEPE
jgi:phosphohistidine swiveling domain-containing protein